MPEKQALDAAAKATGTILDQGVLGALLILALIGLVVAIIYWQKAVARCSESAKEAASLRDELQERRIVESATREAKLSQLLSETASSNVERTRTLDGVVDGLAKVGTALEMLIAEQKASRERWLDRVGALDTGLKELRTQVKEAHALLNTIRLEAIQKGDG